MFDILFGWRKASKCKMLIGRVQCRLKLLKNKRDSIVRHLREDVAQLMINGHQESAANRVEQLFNDENIASVYELLDHFCEFIIIHLSNIRKHKDCPDDINEAVSSLIFASARCGDLPELRLIRKLFGERYGQRFAMAAVELYPGNLVNHQIKDKLSIKSVPDNVKHRLVEEIIRDHFLQSGILVLEFCSELQQQQVKEKLVNFNALSTGICHPDSDIISTSINSSIFQQSPIYIGEYPMHNEAVIIGLSTKGSQGTSRICSNTLEQKEDIEEVYCQDQRLFKFKSPVLDKIENFEDGCEQSYMDQNESLNENSDLSGNKKSGTRLRRRSLSRENQSVKDHKKDSGDLSEASFYIQKRLKQPPCCFDYTMEECSLEHPCYFCTGDNEDDWEIFQWKRNGELSGDFCQCCCFLIGESNKEKKYINVPQKPTRYSYQNDANVHNSWTGKQIPVTCVRAVTMPPERAKDSDSDSILRSNSCRFRYPNHVHPKLPDYDEIAAKFVALKKEYLQSR